MFSDYSKWGEAHNSGFSLCINECKGKKCVLDLGAHIGLVSMPSSAVLAPEGRIYSFEPAGENLKYLKYHIQINGIKNIEAVDCLVGSCEKDEVPFFEESDYGGLNSTANVNSMVDDSRLFTKSLKRQVSIDFFCKNRDIHPEIIKIDVEGAEIDVLEGALNTLKTDKPVIFLSYHPKHIASLNRSEAEYRAILEKIDYSCMDIITGKEAISMNKREYMLVPKETPREVLEK
jgi:FkbM family methyltransferase